MSIKCLPLLLLLSTIPNSIEMHTHWPNTTPFSDPVLRALFNPPRQKCGAVYCSFPCLGAAPPRVCPDPTPDCAAGCACVSDCKLKATVCFETKHCAERKRLFRRTKQPKL